MFPFGYNDCTFVDIQLDTTFVGAYFGTDVIVVLRIPRRPDDKRWIDLRRLQEKKRCDLQTGVQSFTGASCMQFDDVAIG